MLLFKLSVRNLLFLSSCQAPNRRVQRLMEKENKKLRSAARKKRNETVRVSHPLPDRAAHMNTVVIVIPESGQV